ncbi:hypothetical protein [Pseudomonas umsongensis]|uniref:hypothetical protein n=1 Tax=Pseudomonas umsongensis TaxID=198618 RepID=UPI00200AB88E|nr:hypothetical protein [Pseudomonas umsongensis]MCK8655461.1 hypothetical protein [Pseudomonas umsongensis]
MQLVVSCDYLISPAFCAPEELTACVESLIQIKRSIENNLNNIVIEENALEKLAELGCYPCAQIFNHNLQSISECTYTGRDIARTVNNILALELEEECRFPVHVADWTNKKADPELIGRAPSRSPALLDMLESISLSTIFFKKNYSVLHHPTCGGNTVTFSGELASLLPETQDTLPQNILAVVSVLPDYDAFALGQDAKTLFDQATDTQSILSSFYAGALAILNQRQIKNSKFNFDSFEFGPHFVDSLDENQCGPGQNFSGPLFDSICHVLVKLEKNEVSPFYTDTTRKTQRKRANGDLAWRTHITKGNPALRLLFWTDAEEKIILANVGKKNDLEIL